VVEDGQAWLLRQRTAALGWSRGCIIYMPMAEPLQIHTLVSMPFAENTYVAWRDGSSQALVIDPGLEPQAILDFLHERELVPSAILNTHGHADHIAGNEALKAAFPQAPLIIGATEAPLLTGAQLNLSAAFGAPIISAYQSPIK